MARNCKVRNNRRDSMLNKITNICKGFLKIPTYIALFVIYFYRIVISPQLAGCCRFYPSCSEYGLIAFKRFGFIKGFYLTVKRIARCRPGGEYGYDPVPEKKNK